MGHKAIAFTEHGTMRGMTRLRDDAEEAEIRPIYAVELYLCEDMAGRGLTVEQKAEALAPVPPGAGRKATNEAIYQMERKLGVRDRFHLTVLAKNQTGLQNLMKVVTLGWTKGFWKRPRVDLATLNAHKEGLVVLSGCSSGAIADELINGDVKAALRRAEELHGTFGEDFYGEIMPHSLGMQITTNRGMRAICDGMGIDPVATQDAHYIEPGDWKYQEAMLCIHTHTVLSDPERFTFETHEFWLKTRKEMEEGFREHHAYLPNEWVKRAFDNTMVIGEKCEAKIEIDRFKALVPACNTMPASYGTDEHRFLHDLCKLGWKSRSMDDQVRAEASRRGVSYEKQLKIYTDRRDRELAAILKQKVTRYFLVVWDIYNFARANKIHVGPGRGSVAGSLVAYLLNIVDVDAIRFELLFERFLNPDRIDMPDIDMDFEEARRQDVIQYLRDSYGEDRVAQVAANGKLSGKACLKDISRIMGIPIREIQPVVDSIIERSSGDERASATIEDSFKEFEVCKRFNDKYPEVLGYAKKMEGQVKTLGIHAAGVVVAPEPLINLVPLEVRKNGEVVCAVDMYGVANLGLMKLDILGLRTLTVVRRCLEKIKERHGVDIDLNWIPLDDPETLSNFTAHDYTGVFQFDTPSADKISEGVSFDNFNDVSAMIALDRPGTARSGLATEYLKRKKDPKARKSVHPVVDAICANTYGVIVYQEHVQRIFTDVAGFSAATADSLRRAIAKKYGDEAIGKERVAFIEGAVKRGFKRELAEKLISQITFFGSYGFNLSHSVSYGLISYRQMYLKTHYPTEFLWALMATEPVTEKVVRYVGYARRREIEVRPPDVNISGAEWTIDGDAIVGALSDLRGVGPSAIVSLEPLRPFKSFIDFCERVERRKVHRGVVKVLAQAGALDSLIPNRKVFVEHVEHIWALVGKSDWKARMARSLVAMGKMRDWDEDEAQRISGEFNPLAFGKDPLEAYATLIEELGLKTVPLDSPDMWTLGAGFISGRILEVRYNQVGDFHTGPEPSDAEKRKMKWGSRYSNINVMDMSGKQQRIKVDVDIFDTFRPIVDQGSGTVVALHVNFNQSFHSIRAHFLVDLDALRKRRIAGAKLTLFERALSQGTHPVAPHSKANIKSAYLAAKHAEVSDFSVIGMVSHVNIKLDKNYNEMAFFGLLGYDGYIEVICFSSSWKFFRHQVKPGVIGKFRLKRDDKSLILDDHLSGAIQLLPSE